jgi:hypothetical protein
MVGIDRQWAKLEAVLSSPHSARLGYIDQEAFQEAVRSARIGNPVQVVELLHGLALELWLRDLSQRELLSVPEIFEPQLVPG